MIWLSHILDENTPLYGGESRIGARRDKSIAGGDSCNTSLLSFSSHTGSHVDAPRHFIEEGHTIDFYGPSDWVFTSPLLLDVPSKPGSLIGINELPEINCSNSEIDLLLIRTGLEKLRGQELYWKEGCGCMPELAEYLCANYPALRAIGLDTISLTSYQNRELGRKAHHAFLSREIRIFEDLKLGQIKRANSLTKVIALPMRIAGGDGAPCTVVGWEKSNEE